MLFTTLLLSALTVLPCISAHSPRFVHIPAHHSLPRRALPRTGRRMNARAAGQATVRCDTEYTWSLCDGDNCTAMGEVAAGTACVDGAITWADSGKVAGADAGGAAITKAWNQALDPSTAAATIRAPEPTSIKEVLSTTTKPVKASPSATQEEEEAAPEKTSSSRVVVVAAVSTSSRTPPSSSRTPPSSSRTPSSPSYTPPASSSSPVVQQIVATSSSAPRPAPTPSSVAPSPSASTSPPPPPSGDAFSGFASFYDQGGAYGACGRISQDSEKVVALAIARYGTGSNNAPDCGRQVSITNKANGKTTTATVQDACPGTDDSLDLSRAAFAAIGDFDTGILEIEWHFL